MRTGALHVTNLGCEIAKPLVRLDGAERVGEHLGELQVPVQARTCGLEVTRHPTDQREVATGDGLTVHRARADGRAQRFTHVA